jgi:peptide/nickel transport system substrate-binding protein
MYIDNPTPATFYEYASWAYDATAGAVPTYDPDRAKSLLAQAGYPNGNGLNISIITNAGNEYRAQEETYIQAAMASLGVKVTVKQAEWGAFIAGVQAGNYDTAVLSTGTSIPDPTAFDSSIVTGGAVNYSGYSNPQVDSLLAQAGATLDQSARKALYKQVQTILVQDMPYVPTAWYPNSLVIEKRYGNVDPSVIGPFWNIGSYTLAST